MGIASWLNGGTASQLRGLAWLALHDTGYPLAGSATTDQGGGATLTWTAGAVTPCRIDPLAGRELLAAGRVDDRSTHLITVPVGVAVSSAGRFIVSGRGTFEITHVRTRTAAGPLLTFEAVQAD